MKGKETYVYIAAAVIVVALIAFAATRKPAEPAPQPIPAPAAPVADTAPVTIAPPVQAPVPVPQPTPQPQPAAAPPPPFVRPPATATGSPGDVRRMSIDELNERMQRGEVVIVDVRDAEAYAAAHIPGSLHVPVSNIAGEVPHLPRGKPIVTYCT